MRGAPPFMPAWRNPALKGGVSPRGNLEGDANSSPAQDAKP